MTPKLSISTIPWDYAICRLDALANIPDWAIEWSELFSSVTRTNNELSILCDQTRVPTDFNWEISKDRKWLKVDGILDFALTWILANIARILVEADISIFAISTYDTDYIFVDRVNLEKTLNVLKEEYLINS